jgi:hypothetical protein
LITTSLEIFVSALSSNPSLAPLTFDTALNLILSLIPMYPVGTVDSSISTSYVNPGFLIFKSSNTSSPLSLTKNSFVPSNTFPFPSTRASFPFLILTLNPVPGNGFSGLVPFTVFIMFNLKSPTLCGSSTVNLMYCPPSSS